MKQCVTLLAHISRGRHDRARDWSNLHERMTYIVNLFRSRQQDPSLGDAPLAQEQLAELLAGRLPPPPLLPPRRHRDAAPADLA